VKLFGPGQTPPGKRPENTRSANASLPDANLPNQSPAGKRPTRAAPSPPRRDAGGSAASAPRVPPVVSPPGKTVRKAVSPPPKVIKSPAPQPVTAAAPDAAKRRVPPATPPSSGKPGSPRPGPLNGGATAGGSESDPNSRPAAPSLQPPPASRETTSPAPNAAPNPAPRPAPTPEPSGDAWLPHVGTYRRELPVSLARLYENVLDWEHLPHLHRSSFARIERLDSGDWGWRALASTPKRPDHMFELELVLDRPARRWITKTVRGPGQGTQIWTHAIPVAEWHTDIVVDFFVPGIPRQQAKKAGEAFVNLYAKLYDEDVDMMRKRQAALDRTVDRSESASPLKLGRLDQVRAKLPFVFEMGYEKYRMVELDGQLVAHVIECPHMLGPLQRAPVVDGVIECPWHGYRFDIRTGKCVHGMKKGLSPAPKIRIDPKSNTVVALMPAMRAAPAAAKRTP